MCNIGGTFFKFNGLIFSFFEWHKLKGNDAFIPFVLKENCH